MLHTEVPLLENQELFEKHAEDRIQARIAIFHGPHQKKILTDYSINISTGGVFIETSMILPEGSELIVKFSLPNSNTLIATKARVAWVNGPVLLKKQSLPPGMGLQFIDLSSEVMQVIRAYLFKNKFEPSW